MDFDRDIDAEGLLCPLPVLRAGRALRGMAAGEVLRLRATDRAAVVDVPHFCREGGHAFLGAEDHGAVTHYFIRKG
jgi:tRNA 2-thiouridine synthesizing protein A